MHTQGLRPSLVRAEAHTSTSTFHTKGCLARHQAFSRTINVVFAERSVLTDNKRSQNCIATNERRHLLRHRYFPLGLQLHKISRSACSLIEGSPVHGDVKGNPLKPRMDREAGKTSRVTGQPVLSSIRRRITLWPRGIAIGWVKAIQGNNSDHGSTSGEENSRGEVFAIDTRRWSCRQPAKSPTACRLGRDNRDVHPPHRQPTRGFRHHSSQRS